MAFAIDEINNSTSLLPGIHLGYEIHDDCFESLASILPTLNFLSSVRGSKIDVLCNYTEYRSRAIALVGPWTSEQAMITAKLFSLFLFPQVSYGASSAQLNNKKIFPSFLRIMPSDNDQAIAIVSIVKKFKWNWIAGIGSDDEYGRQGIDLVQSYAALEGICVGFIEKIPTYLNLPSTSRKISEIVDYIRKINVNVIVLFSSEGPAQELLKQAVKMNITKKVWIASEAWIQSNVIIHMPGIERIGTVIGAVINSGSMPGFEGYVLNHLTNVRDSREKRFSTEHRGNHTVSFWPYPTSRKLLSSVQHLSPDNLSIVLDQPVRRETFSVYTAVYSIAHALHALLGCHTGRCQTTTKWYNWQLLEELKRVNVSIHGTAISFNAEGNTQSGYDIITWTQHSGQLQLPVIGSYKDHLTINASQIQWKTDNNEIPQSYCSKRCGLGQKKIVISLYSCCFKCEDCPSGTFQNSTGEAKYLSSDTYEPHGFSCHHCQPDEWSPPKSPFCFQRTLQYLSMSSPLGATQLLFMVLDLTLILAIMMIVLMNSGAPIVSESEPVFWLMLGYSGLQALSCFMCTFLIQTPAHTYNLAREISVSMILFITIWICFIPTYPAVNKNHAPAVQTSAMLLSSLAILGAYFIPKCFVLWFKPQYNTSDYFQVLLVLPRGSYQSFQTNSKIKATKVHENGNNEGLKCAYFNEKRIVGKADELESVLGLMM
ncbi:taste receptor type 1 member 3-like [Rhinoraja longicauda]